MPRKMDRELSNRHHKSGRFRRFQQTHHDAASMAFDAVMLAGVSFAGFNLVDPTLVFEEFSKPVIVISRTKPDNIAVKNALLQHFEDNRHQL